MKSVSATQIIKKIDETVADIKSLEDVGLSPLNSSYLAKFLVVYISGLYEKLIKGMLSDKALFCGDSDSANFITGYRWYSPTFANIVSLFDNFNKEWGTELKKIDDKYKYAISSIANNKNSIAHGSDVTLTLKDVCDYYNDSKVLIEKIDNILLGV